ncbi:MAG: hypothetical protein ABL984_13960 [Pyrinomonadaceae bacterium]
MYGMWIRSIEIQHKLLVPMLSESFQIKTAVKEKLVFINQLIEEIDDPELLKWLRNQVSVPYVSISKKLDEKKEHLQIGHSAK